MWHQALLEAYGSLTGMGEEGITPLCHLTAEADVEITVSEDGEFISAKRVEKSDATTTIPVSKDSGSRGNSDAPHPLHDKLIFIASDYVVDEETTPAKDSEEEKKRKKQRENKEKHHEPYHNHYLEQLREWCRAPDTPDAVKAVCLYLESGGPVDDLKKSGAYGKDTDFVRFSVRKKDGSLIQPWKDTGIIESYTKYSLGFACDTGVDYVTGKIMPLTAKHNGKLRHAGDRAKLVSSNDKDGLTYRGRFRTAEEALSVGKETQLKYEAALRFLREKCGYASGTSVTICFARDGRDILQPYYSTMELVNSDNKTAPDSPGEYREKLLSYLQSEADCIGENSDVVLMTIDTADGQNQGPLAIPCYQEMPWNEYFTSLYRWHDKCSWWLLNKAKDNSWYTYLGAPSLYDITTALYGQEIKGKFAITSQYKKVAQVTELRLLKIIINDAAIPPDLVYKIKAAIRRTGRLSPANRSRCIRTICALVNKVYRDNGGEHSLHVLREDISDPSYLYGRLLGLADWAEERIIYRQNSKRDTAAISFWNAYLAKPAGTWQRVDAAIKRLYSRLEPKEKTIYLEWLEAIRQKLEGVNMEDTAGLYFLPGYYAQKEMCRKEVFYGNKGKNAEQQD